MKMNIAKSLNYKIIYALSVIMPDFFGKKHCKNSLIVIF